MGMYDLEQRPTSWWGRNWKWFVPTAVVAGILLLAAGAAAMVFVIFSLIKSSGAYAQGLERVQQSPEVQQYLGTPVTDGWYVSGNVQVNGPSGWANLAFPISGPNGKGSVFLEAEKAQGTWNFTYLGVDAEGAPDRIVLVQTAH